MVLLMQQLSISSFKTPLCSEKKRRLNFLNQTKLHKNHFFFENLIFLTSRITNEKYSSFLKVPVIDFFSLSVFFCPGFNTSI